MNQEVVKKKLSWLSYLVVGIVILIAAVTQGRWYPAAVGFAQKIVTARKVAVPDAHDHGDGGHDHGDHGDHDEHGHDDHAGHGHEPTTQSLELSAQARLNLGLTEEYLQPLKLQEYYKSLSMPGMIVERPGRSRIDVSAPLTGVVMEIYHEEGETVNPGDPLFKMKLTHQVLMQLQTNFLKRLGELKVDELEIVRLEKATASGAIPGKQLLDRQYSRNILLAELKSQRESLRLYGFSAEQIQEVERTGHLMQELTVVASSPTDHQPHELHLSGNEIRPVSFQPSSRSLSDGSLQHQPELVIQNLQVDKGQSIQVGATLCELVDYSRLYIEGMAFEGDAASLAYAMQQGWGITALMETSQGIEKVTNLKMVFVSNKISQDTRTLSYYIDLPNVLLRDQTQKDHRRFITWRFRPGQRVQLQIPIEKWEKEFVVPVDAIAKEGAEYFVFLENGKKFDSVAVHVKHRDQISAVIANDGSLFPGDVIALRSATRMFDAIKNKAGGGVDPHAGHNH